MSRRTGTKRRIPWPLITLLIALASIWAVAAQAGSLSLESFWDYLQQANPLWLGAAVAAMLGFVVFEAQAVWSICRTLGHPASRRAGLVYSASDIYFSAITPSATGGQPACAMLMMRDGIPGPVTTAVLMVNLTMYTLSILAIGLLCLLLRPGVFLRFGTPGRILILVGAAIQLGLALVFFLMVRSERLLHRLCSGVLWLLGRLHLLRAEQRLQTRLNRAMEDYRQCSQLLAGQRRVLVRVFVYNLLQRLSQISVTMLVYLSMGGRRALDVLAMQSYVVLGSNCVPVPGAMGVADYLMLDGLGTFLPEQQAVRMELLSRAVSFYCCIALCAAVVLFAGLRRRKDSQ